MPRKCTENIPSFQLHWYFIPITKNFQKNAILAWICQRKSFFNILTFSFIFTERSTDGS